MRLGSRGSEERGAKGEPVRTGRLAGKFRAVRGGLEVDDIFVLRGRGLNE